jgi:hypothetical protein
VYEDIFAQPLETDLTGSQPPNDILGNPILSAYNGPARGIEAIYSVPVATGSNFELAEEFSLFDESYDRTQRPQLVPYDDSSNLDIIATGSFTGLSCSSLERIEIECVHSDSTRLQLGNSKSTATGGDPLNSHMAYYNFSASKWEKLEQTAVFADTQQRQRTNYTSFPADTKAQGLKIGFPSIGMRQYPISDFQIQTNTKRTIQTRLFPWKITWWHHL